MSILSYFGNELTKSLILMSKSTTVSQEDYTVVNSYTVTNTSVKACIYSKALAERYFGDGMWKADVKYVAIVSTSDVTNFGLYDHVMMGSTEYSIDSIDDIAFQNDITLLGLKGVI